VQDPGRAGRAGSNVLQIQGRAALTGLDACKIQVKPLVMDLAGLNPNAVEPLHTSPDQLRCDAVS
jgi:hypothetical protein